ncbi:MAG: hypothetical protein C5B50_04295 [Verrucomicrobia bacterium]|nr:MAG: hypothetical protein C5B50_04295 [Verrucomicrobiota bacterium]
MLLGFLGHFYFFQPFLEAKQIHVSCETAVDQNVVPAGSACDRPGAVLLVLDFERMYALLGEGRVRTLGPGPP